MAIRRAFIWLLAAIFVLAGMVARTSPMLPAMAQDHRGAMVSVPDAQHDYDAHQGHGGPSAAAVMADCHNQAQPKIGEHDDDCLKCCTMCGVTSMTAEYPGTPVSFAYGTVRFNIVQRHLLGHPVALDPDIPKSIV
jgi:hypothetical protein